MTAHSHPIEEAGNQEVGASALPTGLSSLRDEAADASSPKASIPSREADARGSLVVGKSCTVLRNGSFDLILMWEAVKRPVSVDEGGGWYSAHPTDKAWVFRSWMAHKRAPGWSWPKVSSEHHSDLATLVERAFHDAQKRYGVTPGGAA